MGILDSIGSYLGDEENRLNLASGFAGMSGNPNAGNIQQGYQNRLTALRSDRKLENATGASAEQLKRQTALALQMLGNKFPEISKALVAGFITPNEAIKESRAPAKSEGAAIDGYRLAQEQGFKGTWNEYKLALNKSGASSNTITVGGASGAPAKAPDGMTNITDATTGVVTQVPISGGVVDINAQKQVTNANNAIETINSALGHAGLNAAVGSLDSMFKSVTPDAVAFEAYHDQIKGKAFLAAFESLKGGGQITEVEGLKAEQATARLNLAQDEEDYKKALMDLRDVIKDVLERNQGVLDRIPTSGQSSSNDPMGIR